MSPLVAEFAPDFPDHELVHYRNQVLGFECLVAIPKDKIAAAAAAKRPPPFWRNGEVMEVRPPTVGAAAGVVPELMPKRSDGERGA